MKIYYITCQNVFFLHMVYVANISKKIFTRTTCSTETVLHDFRKKIVLENDNLIFCLVISHTCMFFCHFCKGEQLL